MKQSLHLALAAMACAALTACTTERSPTAHASADPPAARGTAMGASAKPFDASDREFALIAAESNLFEIKAAQMARQRGSAPDVLQLAAMIEQDHTMAMNELATLMRARGVAVPNGVPPAQQQVLDKLGASRGADFDQAYVMQAGVKSHEDDIKAFQLALSNAADPELRAWTRKTLPLLRKHMATAQQLAAKYG